MVLLVVLHLINADCSVKLIIFTVYTGLAIIIIIILKLIRIINENYENKELKNIYNHYCNLQEIRFILIKKILKKNI